MVMDRRRVVEVVQSVYPDRVVGLHVERRRPAEKGAVNRDRDSPEQGERGARTAKSRWCRRSTASARRLDSKSRS